MKRALSGREFGGAPGAERSGPQAHGTARSLAVANEAQVRLVLERLSLLNGCTIGSLSVNGNFQCWTLEDTVRAPGVKIAGQTAIPFGTYKVITDMSQRFGRVMMHVMDVPGFAGIRIHSGNSAGDTEGCILVGLDRFSQRIGRSKDALAQLQPKVQAALDAGEAVRLEITQPQAGEVVG